MPTDLTDELARESRYLTDARAALHAMRERTRELLDADVAADPFSAEALAKVLWRRMEQLLDDGTTPLFFGRIDHTDGGPYGGETYYVGRRHVADADGEPLVLDWRAPVSTVFYRANATAPMGLARRRRFGFQGGRLTSFEDERLALGDHAGQLSRILTDEIERPRVGAMRDIVATIQPDQDALVRAELAESICIQGAPGTGKTAVGLHRAAYLLFAHREQLRHNGVLVVGPNRAFISYIAQVLPALGEVDVVQLTVDELVPTPVRGADAPDVARIKGSARMATVLRRALDAQIRRPADELVVPDGAFRLRIGAGELGRIVDDVRREGLPYGAGRERVCARIADRLRRQLEQRGESPPERWVQRIARSRTVQRTVEAVWPTVDPAALVASVLADGEVLAAAADGVLTEDEQSRIRWAKAPRGVRSVRWSAADAVLIDEVAGLIGRLPTFRHVIVDEAQDLSPMQCRAIGRRSTHGSLTVLGDLAQGTAVSATDNWADTLAHLGKPDARIIPLTTGYRVPAEVLALANRLLPRLATGVLPAASIRRSPGSLQLRRAAASALHAAVREAIEECLATEGSIAVIAAGAAIGAITAELTAAGLEVADVESAVPGEDGARITVVPAALAKGLEYDQVVVVEPADIVAAEPRGLHRLYVVLTRAVSRLVVVHEKDLPEALDDLG